MKTTIKVEKEVEIKILEVKAGVRYWEDAEVSGVDGDKGYLIPCRKDDYWYPVIDFDNGIILNWTKGLTAKVHYKVVDNGSYYLKDENGEVVLKIEDNYVPSCLCPKEEGYGDYIIMDIDENGVIADWEPTISSFIDND